MERRVLLTSITIDLQAGSDSGISDTDNITNDTTPTYDVTVDGAGTIEIDVDGDSVVDITTTADGAGVYPVTAVASGTFGGGTDHTEYGTGQAPYSVFSADFNNDGIPDLVTANYAANNVSVLLNDGDGTFAAQVGYAMGTGTASVFSDDFNGDGNADLAAANLEADSVSVRLGSGDGTFGSKTDYTTNDQPSSVFSADLVGDDNVDLVVANYNANNVSVFQGNGDGTFGSKADHSTGTNNPYCVFGADFDNDTNVDLVTANPSSNNVSVMLNNGDGTFGCTDYAMDDWPIGVLSTDFDGDGNTDLATVNSSGDSISVRLGNGDGTFQSRADYAAGSIPYSICSADFDTDGDVDLATADFSDDGVSVLLGDGDGTFGPKTAYAMDTGPSGVFSADFNRDGIADLATANYTSNNISVRLGEATPLSDGLYPVNARFTDHEDTATDSDPTTIDTVTEAVTVDLQAASDSGVSDTDNITNDTTPTFDVTVSEAGTIEIDYDGDLTPDDSTLAGAGGTYQFTPSSPLSDGVYPVNVTFTDLAGNTPTTDSDPTTIDTVTEAVTVDLQAASDSGVSDTDNITNDTTPTYDVTVSEAGTIEIDYDGDLVPDDSMVVGTGGTYQFTPSSPLSDGDYPVNVTFADVAGNPTAGSDPTTIDTVTEAVTVDLQAASDSGVSDTDNITNDTTPTFDVTVSEAGTIEIDYDGDSTPDDSTAVGTGGTYQFTPSSPLSDGDYPVNVTFTDLAGNTPTTDSDPTTIDTVTEAVTVDLQAASDSGVSDTDNVTNDTTPTYDVTVSEAGTIEIDYDGDLVPDDSTAVGAGGTYQFTPSSPLSDGDYPVNVTFADVAGNPAADSDPTTIDTAAPRVEAAWVSSTHGSWAFGNVLFGGADLTTGVVPWTRVNQTGFGFSEDVYLGADPMSFSASFREGTLDPGTAGQPSQEEAIWTWSDPGGGLGGYLDKNWIKVKLNASDIEDLAGNPMEADYFQNVKVLPGDVDGSSVVLSPDRLAQLASLGKIMGMPGYNPRADVNGDGFVISADRLSLLSYLGQFVLIEPSDPSGETLLSALPSGASMPNEPATGASELLRAVAVELRRAPAFDLLGRLSLRASWSSGTLLGRVKR